MSQEEERNRRRAALSEQARSQLESGVPTEQVSADLMSKGLSRWEAVELVRAILEGEGPGEEGVLNEQVEQVRRQLKSGVPTEQARADLVSKGFSRWEAVEMVHSIRGGKGSGEAVESRKRREQEEERIRGWVYGFLMPVLAGFLLFVLLASDVRGFVGGLLILSDFVVWLFIVASVVLRNRRETTPHLE